MELLSQINFNEGGSGCWGHTDSRGIEYAIIGTRQAIRILSLEDPKNPTSRLVIPGSNNIWREARAWGDFIYVTTESADGVTIIDMTKGPDQMTWKRWLPRVPEFNTDSLRTVHSINMDDFGFMYLNGHNLGSRGVLIYDVKEDGNNPKFMSSVGNVYTHDCYATGTILYTADLGNGVGIYDIKDKTKPVFLNRFNTSSVFTHNMWTSPDEKFLYTTDERSGAYVDVYDVTDSKSVKFISKYRNEDSQLGRVIPHNVYTVGNHAVTSWYTDGVLIKDMTRPDNVVKVGEYDTYLNEAGLPQNGNWFEGCWGVYPFLKSGTIVASDINTGLWIFKPTYVRACYLEGQTYAEDSEGVKYPISNAKISIKASRNAFGFSNESGIYKTGIAEPGLYKIYYEHPTYGKDSAEVELKTGEVFNKDFIFSVKSLKLKAVDKNGKLIQFSAANVQTQGSSSESSIKADNSGIIKFPTLPGKSFKIQIAAWGYKGKEITFTETSSEEVVLEEGYEDDFFADLGWNNIERASAGNWERVIPKGTKQNSELVNPEEDATEDIGNLAYITGNGGNQPGENDVDNGSTVLESPLMDFSAADSAIISYERWFYNGGGNTTPNDNVVFYLDNGQDVINLEDISASFSVWIPGSITVKKEDLKFTDKMTFGVNCTDRPGGHLVEGGLDKFKVTLFNTTVISKDENLDNISLSPNPASNFIEISGSKTEVKFVEIFDIKGKRILTGSGLKIDLSNLPNGVYNARINQSDKSIKFVVNR